MTTFIYALLNDEGGVYYVGKSDSPKTRYRGQKAKDLVVLAEVPQETFKDCESRYIALFRSQGFVLLNKNDGGGGTKQHSEETLEKMSGENNHNFGKSPTLETLKKRSAALTGVKHSPERCAKNSASHKGEKNPHFGKFGANHPAFGTSRTQAQLEKMSALHKGKKHTPADLEKMSASQMGEKNHMFGKTHLPTTREKMSAAQKARRLREKSIPA